MYQVLGLLRQGVVAFVDNLDWMGWNLFLALVPLGLSFWLFGPTRRRSPLWWIGAAVWLAFLPNAPYVLTDIIHLIQQIRLGIFSVYVIALVLIPEYLLFILTGFSAYVLSLLMLERYLKQQGRAVWLLPVELTIHGLSAVGIYLGRFQRLNSWDLITQLDYVVSELVGDLISKQPLLLTAASFVVLVVLYRLVRVVLLALIAYRQANRPGTTGNPRKPEKTAIG